MLDSAKNGTDVVSQVAGRDIGHLLIVASLLRKPVWIFSRMRLHVVTDSFASQLQSGVLLELVMAPLLGRAASPPPHP